MTTFLRAFQPASTDLQHWAFFLALLAGVLAVLLFAWWLLDEVIEPYLTQGNTVSDKELCDRQRMRPVIEITEARR